MADIANLIEVLMRQQKEQMDEQARQHREQMAVLKVQVKTKEDKLKNLIEAASDGARGSFAVRDN